MAFFDNLSEVISNKGKEAKEAAKKMAEIASLRGQINGVNTEIKKNYIRIGEAYFEAYKDSEVTCEFEESVQAIRDAKKAVEELEKKIRDLKGDVKCTGCDSLVPADSVFCPKCGTKLETEPEFFDEEDEEAEGFTEEFTEEFIVPEETSKEEE